MDGGGGSSFRLAKAGGCDTMRCGTAQSPSRFQGGSRPCQGVSDGRSLGSQVQIPLADKRGGCVVGDVGLWMRDLGGLTRSRARAVKSR
jgi:hypothetical protein